MPFLWPKATDASREAGYPLKIMLFSSVDWFLAMGYWSIFGEKWPNHGNYLHYYHGCHWNTWSIRYVWMISQMMWSSSHWGRKQSFYLWEFRQKWAHRNLMKFQKSKCEVLGPGLNNCTSGQARDKLTERFAEKSWRLMVGKKLTVSWHCALQKSGLVTSWAMAARV